MKRLWVILFVVPIFAQNPCSEEERLKIHDGDSFLDEVTSKKLKKFDDKCREYLAKSMATMENQFIREENLRLKNENQNLKDEIKRLKDEMYQTGDMLNKVNKGYVKSRQEIELLKIELENLKYSENRQRNSKTIKREQSDNDGKDVLMQLLNEYKKYRGIDTPNTPSLLSTMLCQFDNSKLFTNGETKYGQGLTKFRLWICPSDNSHQFWLPD